MRLITLSRPNELREQLTGSRIMLVRLEVEVDNDKYKTLEDVILGLISLLTEIHREKYRPETSGMEPGGIRRVIKTIFTYRKENLVEGVDYESQHLSGQVLDALLTQEEKGD